MATGLDTNTASASASLGITVFGVAAYFAYGCDFPRLNVRFSRLV